MLSCDDAEDGPEDGPGQGLRCEGLVAVRRAQPPGAGKGVTPDDHIVAALDALIVRGSWAHASQDGRVRDLPLQHSAVA
eukprot:6758571-Pyramimonas_sp.AAC.1